MKVCPKCSSPHSKPGTYCSRKCANSIGGFTYAKMMNRTGRENYRDIAFRLHGTRSCLLCGFDKVVEVHHVDHDNNTKSNLVILCPNHHMMIHRSKYSEEVIREVAEVLGD